MKQQTFTQQYNNLLSRNYTFIHQHSCILLATHAGECLKLWFSKWAPQKN